MKYVSFLLLLSGCVPAENVTADTAPEGMVQEAEEVAPQIPDADSSDIQPEEPPPQSPDMSPPDDFSPEEWFQTSTLKKTLEGQLKNPELDYCAAGSPAEPYIIVRGNGISDDYAFVGSSLDRLTEDSLADIRTVVLCENVYSSAFYRASGSTDTKVGSSEGVRIHCLDAGTGFYYFLRDSVSPMIDVIEPEDLPEKTTNLPRYEISDEDVVRFVEVRFPRWHAKYYRQPDRSDVRGILTDDAGISYKLYDDYAEVSAYIGEPGAEIVIPAEIDGTPVCAVAEEAFRESSISGVTFLCSNLEIREKAFELCRGLRTVAFRGGNASVGGGAFSRCENLTSVDFGGASISLGDSAFGECRALEALYGVKNLVSMPYPRFAFSEWCPLLKEANTETDENGFTYLIFDDCAAVYSYDGEADTIEIPSEYNGLPVTALLCRILARSKASSIVIPDSVKCLCDSALAYSLTVTQITLPEGLTVIGKELFQDDRALQAVLLPESVTQICRNAFDGCTSLQALNLPNGLRSIDSHAFEHCTSIAEISVPASVSFAGRGIFGYWTEKQTVYVEESADTSGWDELWNGFTGAVILFR